jgi:hypothetical protein
MDEEQLSKALGGPLRPYAADVCFPLCREHFAQFMKSTGWSCLTTKQNETRRRDHDRNE